MKKNLTRSLLAGILLLTMNFQAFAVDEVNVTSGATTAGAPLAVHGYDVVAYFSNSKPTVGSYKFSTAYKGGAYRFANKANLKAFKADPEKYIPAFGGFCAYGVAVGKKFDGDPNLWKIVDGRLYLNLNADIQATWEKDVPGNIVKANDHWSNIRSIAVGKL